MHDTRERLAAAEQSSPATSPGRRSFLRRATGAALAVVASGAATVLRARPAAATTDEQYETNLQSCCAIVLDHSPWCPYYCAAEGGDLYCWSCNKGACRCCECFVVAGYGSCWEAGIAFDLGCSYRIGCCDKNDSTTR